MPSIKYNTDEQDNKKIIIRVDPETDETKVSCGCCACGGCGSLSEVLDGITSLSFQVNAQYTVDGDSKSVSGSRVMQNFYTCGANGYVTDQTPYNCTYISVFVDFGRNNQGNCIAGIYAGAYDGIMIGGVVDDDGNQLASCAATDGIYGYVTVPIDEIIGTHTLQNLVGFYEGITFPISLTVTIS